MKKLLILVAGLISVLPVFSQIWEGKDKIIEDFLEKGSYIKRLEDDDEYSYFPKTAISGYLIQDDAFVFSWGPEGDGIRAGIDRWTVESDENCNIILKRKK